MTGLLKALVTLVAVCMLASCNYDDMIEKWAPKEESEFAKDYLAKLRNRDFEYIRGFINPKEVEKANDELLTETAGYFRGRDPISTELVGWRINVVNGQWNGSFSFEYEFEDGWNLATTTLRKLESGYEVTGFHVYQTVASQKELNAFTLGSRTFVHYSVLGLALFVPTFVLVSVIVCIRTPMPKRKWLWLIFMVLGVTMVQLNWTTGHLSFRPLSVQLFGASAVKGGPYAPWIVSASVPIGSIAFWLKRRKLLAAKGKTTDLSVG